VSGLAASDPELRPSGVALGLDSRDESDVVGQSDCHLRSAMLERVLVVPVGLQPARAGGLGVGRVNHLVDQRALKVEPGPVAVQVDRDLSIASVTTLGERYNAEVERRRNAVNEAIIRWPRSSTGTPDPRAERASTRSSSSIWERQSGPTGIHMAGRAPRLADD
jgi:hypothetical protein